MQERTSLPEKRGNHSLRAILDGSPAPPHPKSSAAEGSRGLSGEEEREGELRASIRSGGGSQVRRACSGGRIAGGRRRERERRRRWRGGISSSDFSPHDGREQSRSSSRPRSIEPSAQKAHGRVVSLGQGRPNKPRPRLAAAIAQPCSYSSSGRRHRRHSCPPRRPRSRRRARPPRRPRSHRQAAVLS
ncbi:hypothetical protein DAI22_12g077600 [Oryza sativa Japonica Group]|jgi:hypothetical protein|nr:hypothetical protein DAI22_12g077600 [Oryza sativa Japonica Group]